MKFNILFAILLFVSITGAYAFTDSNLPIVVITTDNNPSTGIPYEILDNPRVLATMKIIYHPDGSRNYLTDVNNTNFLNYTGRISIEIRGSTSQSLPKKPYGLTTLNQDNTTNNNISILGMPKENDWILNSLAFDPSLIRDFLSYDLYRSMGNYAARGVYCELMLNGVYKGLYIFMEKLKIDDNRINISKMTTADNSGQNLTGGYVTKCDKTTGGDPVAWNIPYADFIHDSPKPTEITTQQNTYIYNQFYALKNLTGAQNSSITTGFPTIIDIPSFIDFMIMNELSSNVDGYMYSSYFHKDRNGKLRAGPIWDFNLTYGNDLFSWGYDRSHTDVWQFNDGGNTGPVFWKDMFNNSTFQCYLVKRWLQLAAANQPLNYSVISSRIDQLVSHISEAAVREQAQWSAIGNHATQISSMKTWIQARIAWLNTKWVNCTACSSVSVPALVISKIHYNPMAKVTAVSDSLEFLEITNNSNVTVNLTGIYFRELGFTYQFPVNSTISANGKLILASNAKVYEQNYGKKPFGQFTRNLGNKSENLILVDAFGNVIDNVEYNSVAPWPIEADGLGSYLELVDINSDNNSGSNWKASTLISGVDNVLINESVVVYPTQTHNSISINCNDLFINSYEVTDLEGRILISENRFMTTINVEKLSPNMYLLKLHFTDGECVVKKFIKI